MQKELIEESTEKMLQQLILEKKIALTTLSKDDHFYANRLQTASVRGDDGLLYWGLGPKLKRGDLVALYAPDSQFLPPQDRKIIRCVYAVADIMQGENTWHHQVFLHRGVSINPPLSFGELKENVGIKPSEILSAGRRHHPWPKEKAEAFWRLVLETRPELAPRIAHRLLGKDESASVAISYAGEDWTEAQRLNRWCEGSSIETFFLSSVGETREEERAPLRKLLTRAFSSADVAVFFVPREEALSPWLELELDAALASSAKILLIRKGSKREWPRANKKGVVHHDLESAGEGEVLREIKALIRKSSNA